MKTLDEFKEAHRTVHNLFMQYESLGTLRDVLSTTVNAYAEMEEAQALVKQLEDHKDKLVTACKKADTKLNRIEADYAEKSSIQEAKLSKHIEKLSVRRSEESEKFEAFISENQASINSAQKNLDSLNHSVEATKVRTNKEIHAMNEERKKAEKALASVHKKMEAVLGGTS